jgi:DNA-binding transcriptional ArsR family regulator
MPKTKSIPKKPGAAAARGHMVASAPQASSFLKYVSEPTRLQIVLALVDGKKSAIQISERLGRSPTDLSHHLAMLRFSKVVDSNREGSESYYELTEPGTRFVQSILGFLDKTDSARVRALDKASLRKLIKKVGTVVDDPEDWLSTPNPQFEGRRPIDLIGTKDERRVHIIIEAAQQGCFA